MRKCFELIFAVSGLLFLSTIESMAAYTIQLTMSNNGSSANSPLCVNNTTHYFVATVQKGSSDEGAGTIYIYFKDAENNATILTSIAVTIGQYSGGSYSTQSTELPISIAPSNRDNGQIYAVFDPVEEGNDVSSSNFTTSAPFVTVTPSSASLNTELGPTSMTLTASSSSTADFSWSPSTALNTTVGSTVIASPNVTRTYIVTAMSPTGCSGTKSVVVTVTGPCCSSTKAFNNQTIVSDNVNDYITASGSSSMVATSTVNLKAGNYVLLSPDVLLEPSTGAFLALATPCNYAACRIGDFTDNFDAPVLLKPDNAQNNSEKVTIYPNPSSGIFTIVSEDPIDEIIISNDLGEIILTGKTNQIDLTPQPEGIYFISISSKGKRIVKKVFKVK